MRWLVGDESGPAGEKIVSEGELQGQLYLPRRRHRFRNLTRSGVATRRRRKNTRVGLAEVGMIGDVEKFCPELDLLSFRDSESLEERKVQVEQARSNDSLWRGVAVASRRRRNPLHRVKIFVWSAQDGVVVATRFQVGPFGDVAAGLDATAARIIVADGRGRRQSRASPQNRIEGPSARQSVANLSDICSKLLAVPHRKLIGSRSDEVVLDVNRREALLSSAIVPVLRRTLRPLLALAAGISYVSQILSPRVGQVVLQAVTVFRSSSIWIAWYQEWP